MNDSKAEMILSVTELVLKYGIPTAVGIIGAWNTESDPTIEEIRKLKYALPDPETFFE